MAFIWMLPYDFFTKIAWNRTLSPESAMPTYEYHCKKCGHCFDVQQSISAEALSLCPKELCPKKSWGKGKVQRGVGGGSGLLFKGTGFYITDYRSKGYSAAKSKEGTSGSGTAAAAPSPAPSTTAKPVSAPK